MAALVDDCGRFDRRPLPGQAGACHARCLAPLGLATALCLAARDLITARISLAVPALTMSFAGALATTGSGLALGPNETGGCRALWPQA